MDIPQVKVGDIIRIGSNFSAPKAEVVRIYTDEEKKSGVCGDIEVVYYQNKLKGIKDDVVWAKTEWNFKYDGPNGSYVDIDQFDPRLKK